VISKKRGLYNIKQVFNLVKKGIKGCENNFKGLISGLNALKNRKK